MSGLGRKSTCKRVEDDATKDAKQDAVRGGGRIVGWKRRRRLREVFWGGGGDMGKKDRGRFYCEVEL